jgi:hypothetical protein
MTNESFGPTILLRSEQTRDHVGVVELAVPAGWIGRRCTTTTSTRPSTSSRAR